jgi:hypothetical protein
MADEESIPPIFPPPPSAEERAKKLADMKARDAVSPWKKHWDGAGVPQPVVPYEQWKSDRKK